MKHLGLFAGIGGFELAAQYAGWETVAWCEWDAFCQTILKHHFPHATPHSDIRNTEFTRYAGQIDILTGGFPCQPYSTAGKRKGKNDVRHLWPEMLRAIRETSPRWVVGENVRGLVSWNGGVVFHEVQSDLEAEGYEVLPFLLPACGVDAPHERYRIWFVARRIAANSDSDGYQLRRPGENRQAPAAGEGIKQEWQRIWPNTGRTCEPGVVANTTGKGREKRNVQKRSSVSPENTAESIIWAERGRCDGVSDWRGFPTQSPVCGRNDGFPGMVAGITVSKHRRESIKAYGNAIVPQVALQIFKAINQIENR